MTKNIPQDNRVCMFYVVERLSHILKTKDGEKVKISLSKFKDEIIYNLGANVFYNKNCNNGDINE
jgi:hypothetical protein